MLHGLPLVTAAAVRVTDSMVTVRLVIEICFLFWLVSDRFSGTETPGDRPATLPAMVNGLPVVCRTNCTVVLAVAMPLPDAVTVTE